MPSHACHYNISLTYESPKSNMSDLPIRKKANRVSYLYDSGLTRFRYKFEYATLKNSNVQWKDRGWTSRFNVRLSQDRYR